MTDKKTIRELRDEIANLHLLADRLASAKPHTPTLEECEQAFHEAYGNALRPGINLAGLAAVRDLCLERRSLSRVKVNLREHPNGIEVVEVMSDASERQVVVVPLDCWSRAPSHELVEAADELRAHLGEHRHPENAPWTTAEGMCVLCNLIVKYDEARGTRARPRHASGAEPALDSLATWQRVRDERAKYEREKGAQPSGEADDRSLLGIAASIARRMWQEEIDALTERVSILETESKGALQYDETAWKWTNEIHKRVARLEAQPSGAPAPASAQGVAVALAFNDWTRDGTSIYATDQGIELSMGNFHSGTVFRGSLAIDIDDATELRRAIESGALPTFLLFEVNTPPSSEKTGEERK